MFEDSRNREEEEEIYEATKKIKEFVEHPQTRKELKWLSKATVIFIQLGFYTLATLAILKYLLGW